MSALPRHHRTRLLQVWRSGGWPCRDALEIELLTAGLLLLQPWPDGRETVALSSAGVAALAQAQRAGRRALSGHDRLAQKFGEHLQGCGRIVWRELSLRALLAGPAGATAPAATDLLTPEEHAATAAGAIETAATAKEPAATTSTEPAARPDEKTATAQSWRMARPDLFSVRNTTVPAYLQPMVHEVKFSRADLLSDLRDAHKRQAYQWLCSECYYVFPAPVATPADVPEAFGVWLLHGDLDGGRFEMARPARHTQCSLPFAVWMELAKATPMPPPVDDAQGLLGRQHGLQADIGSGMCIDTCTDDMRSVVGSDSDASRAG